MKNVKKKPSKQLEKYSNIFTQLGLVLVLFVVYVTLEHKTEEKNLAASNHEIPEIYVLQPEQNVIFEVEKKPLQKTKVVKKNPLILDAPIKEVDNSKEETVITIPTEKPVKLDLTTVIVLKEPGDEDPIETVPFIMIQNAPIFKGCEGLSKEENKECFDREMKKFVQRNFDAQLANEIGLRSGKYKIQTQFVIDDKGNVVDILIRAPHVKLEKETQQLIEKLPKFTPGMQRDKAVKVKYTLPISFLVD